MLSRIKNRIENRDSCPYYSSITLVLSATAYAESSVWKLASGSNKFYIAGSCHILRKSDYPLPEEFEFAYENVDQVIFETDLESLMRTDIQRLLISIGMYTGNETFEKKISKKACASSVKYCNDNTMILELTYCMC